MPIDPITIGAIGTAAASGANLAFQGNMNKKNRRFADYQYKKQRDDQLEFWRMNNAYNHPSEQMSRLREGGLNPHLVYGTGAVGNASSMADTPQQAKWQGEAPQIDTPAMQNSLDQMYNLEARKAQTDNLREQNTLLKKEQSLKDMELLQKSVNLDTSKLGYQYDKETFESRVFKQMIQNIDTQSIIADRNQRLGMQTTQFDQYERKTWEPKIQGLKETAKMKAAQAELSKLHVRMRRDGIEPGDKVYLRLAAGILNRFGYSLKDLGIDMVKQPWISE